MNNFTLVKDADGIALITFDVPNRSMNDADRRGHSGNAHEFTQTIASDASIKGAIITSGKASGFCAGADLGEMSGSVDELAASTATASFALRCTRRCFTLNKTVPRLWRPAASPIVAAINGLALGGGLEIWPSPRITRASSPIIRRSQLGIAGSQGGPAAWAPAARSACRACWALMKAAAADLLEGKTMSPQEALALGVVHEDGAGSRGPVDRGCEEIRCWASRMQLAPWDKKEFKIPGGGPYTPATAQVFIMGNAMLRQARASAIIPPRSTS